MLKHKQIDKILDPIIKSLLKCTSSIQQYQIPESFISSERERQYVETRIEVSTNTFFRVVDNIRFYNVSGQWFMWISYFKC